MVSTNKWFGLIFNESLYRLVMDFLLMSTEIHVKTLILFLHINHIPWPLHISAKWYLCLSLANEVHWAITSAHVVIWLIGISIVWWCKSSRYTLIIMTSREHCILIESGRNHTRISNILTKQMFTTIILQMAAYEWYSTRTDITPQAMKKYLCRWQHFFDICT